MKNITILVLSILVTQLSFAQSEGEFRFGLKGAANIGWVGGTNKAIEGDGAAIGFAYGIMGDYYFKGGSYGVSTEILLSSVKTKFNVTGEHVFNAASTDTLKSLSYTYNVQYLEIPVSMKFRTKEIGNMTYTGNFGFSPGFAISAKTSITSSGLPKVIADADPTGYRVNESEGEVFTVNNFDDKVFLFRFPLIIGGGLEYKMAGSTSLQGGIRIANSFTDMFVKDKDAIAKNNYVALSVGVLF
jgi:hypothetical protein